MLGQRRGNILRIFQQLKNYAYALLSFSSYNCIYCHSRIRHERNNETGLYDLCMHCQQNIPWIKEVKCKTCGRYEDCYDCNRRTLTHFIANRSAVRYSMEMKEWLARYKYRGDERLLPIFIEMLQYPLESLLQQLPASHPSFDYISYIPLSQERLLERGFNQAEQFAQGLGQIYQIPVQSMLSRTYHSGKQSQKNRGQRLEDLKDAFYFNDESLHTLTMRPAHIEPLHILLVDDVYTTGSTLNHCASIIHKHTKAHVYGLTWAR
ncbi:MAG: transport apparatus-associated-like protein [Bacilli bacterium]|nr:transport apparatus-associated-like protein [Bacilli bacterium]